MIETWSTGPADANMPEDMLVKTFDRVRSHPWWRARARLAVAILRKERITAPAKVMDVGCGWGVNLEALEGAGYAVTGLDISRRILKLIDRVDRRLVQADLNQELPRTETFYDSALALDVIEHVDDDRGAIRRMADLLRPGGTAVISVPALPELYSKFDEIQGHRRRYTPESLRAAFDTKLFSVRQVFWWGTWMVPAVRRMRRRLDKAANDSKMRTYDDYLELPPWPVPLAMHVAFRCEQRPALNGWLRTGTSLFAIAVRH